MIVFETKTLCNWDIEMCQLLSDPMIISSASSTSM